MRVAVIDLGTNTFNLLVRDTVDHEEVHAMKMPVKLGQGGILKRQISDAAMERGMIALKRYRGIINSLDVDTVYAFGTSALRDAENRKVFTEKVKKAFDFNINVISGDEEADLIFEGVKYGTDLSVGRNLIMDIGGGSTEFILSNDGEILWSKSFQVGSSRLNDLFVVSNPITESEIQTIEEYLKAELAELWQILKLHPTSRLIGSSGSFETLAQVTLAQRGHPNESPANAFKISIREFDSVAEYIKNSTLEERLEDSSILNMRADMIVLATVLLSLTVKQLNIKEISLSNFALKEGVFSKLMENKLTWLKS